MAFVYSVVYSLIIDVLEISFEVGLLLNFDLFVDGRAEIFFSS